MDKQKLQEFLKKMQEQTQRVIDGYPTPNPDANILRHRGAFSAYKHIEQSVDKGFFDNVNTDRERRRSERIKP